MALLALVGAGLFVVLLADGSGRHDGPVRCNGATGLCDRRLDQVVFPATHNSYAAADQPGWHFAPQQHGIGRQLDDGIRALLVDIHFGVRDPATGRVTGRAIMLRGGMLARHPDTGVPFDGFEVPCCAEAIALAVRLHREVPGLHSIGWDLAITADGPVFIEGNDNWAAGLRIGLEPGFRDEFVRLCTTG